jgi:sulfur-oxidizing protein SoxY
VQAFASPLPSLSASPSPNEGQTPELQAALKQFSAGAPLQPGRLKIEIDAIVENGNAVPVTVTYTGPPADGASVVALGLFTELNPAPDVAVFRWPAPAPGQTRAALPARVSTRMRLATSQGVIAAARLSDGSAWIHRVDVLVTLAACIEES